MTVSKGYINLGLAMFKQKKFKEAIEQFVKAKEYILKIVGDANDKLCEVVNLIGYCNIQIYNFHEAQRNFSSAFKTLKNIY